MKRLLLLSAALLSFSFPVISTPTELNESLEIVNETICSPTECYTIIKKLGEGAFGNVYAVENSQGLPFAIKVHKSNPDLDISVYEDAEREFLRGQLLSHPNIVKSHDLFTTFTSDEEKHSNIVLDYIEGQTIFNTKKGDVSNTNSLNAAVQLIDALRYALTLDLLHLDLHGGNVMLDKDHNIKVIDLASFFTYDELFSYVTVEEDLSADKEEKTPQTTSSKMTARTSKSVRMNIILSTELTQESLVASSSISIEPTKVDRLRKFFDQNPKLFRQLKRQHEEMKVQKEQKTPVSLHSRTQKSLSAHYSQKNAITSSKQTSNTLDRTPIQSYYFDRVTEMCVKLITVSNLSRDEKINLRAEIKKIMWNYEEDIDEGTSLNVDNYLETLRQLLLSN